MAFVAFDFDVFPFQGISGSVVLLHAKERRLPAFHGMAFRAFALFWPRVKLAFVRVGLVAIRAVLKRQRLLEIAFQVALRATDGGMLPKQRVLGFGMIKLKLGQEFFPARRGVTVFAALGFERALVGIDVTIEASGKLHVLIAWWPARLVRLVAFFASDFDVQARQRIARLRMVKLIRGFPIRKVVALQAVVAELALVHIFVARHAILGQSEKRSRKIFHLDERALVADHVHGGVAYFASDASMLAVQVVARQPMVKLLLRRLPVD